MPHKLLLADDSVTIQRVIELTFADEDVHVHAVGDGKKAIESIQSDRPDIVLADVGMPERDGYEVAEFVKRNPQLADIPVLLLTGAFEPIDETRARAVGCDGVLVKPFEPQMVINRVKDLLAGRRTGGLWGAKPAPPAPERAPAPAQKEASSQPAPAAAGSAASASLEEYFDRLDAAFASVEAATDARSAAPALPPPASSPAVPLGSAAAGLSTDDFPGWDPDLTGDPQRPDAATPAPPQSLPAEPPAVQPPGRIPFVSQAPPAPVAPQAALPMPSTEVQARPPQPTPMVSPAPAVVSVPRPAADTPVSVHTPSQAADRETVAPHVPPTATPPPAAPSPAAVPSHGVVAVPSLADAFAALLAAEQGRRVSPSTVGSATISDEAVNEIVERVIARMTDTVVRETVLDVAERLVREEIDRIKAH
jgi:CheY-like chemotaxis protein